MKRSIMIAVAAALMLPAEMALADGTRPVAPPSSWPDLAGQWWQWSFSVPAGQNPALDATGVDCMIGQRGPIWFLGGSFIGAATRSCTVPSNTTFFFPIINDIQFNSPKFCGQDSTSLTVAQLRQNVGAYVDAATNISVVVDGASLPSTTWQRVHAKVFEVTLPTNNVYAKFGFKPCPNGVYSPAVDDGYYTTIQPLPVGKHVVHFHAESGQNVQDITYNLNVVQATLK